MARKSRCDSATKAVQDFKSASEGVKLPDRVYVRDADKPFWDAIVSAKAADKWTDSDLDVAANLARCKGDIERIQCEIYEEGDILTNQRGTPVVNPKHTLLETLSRRAVALSRLLHIHPEATQGKARDQVKSNDSAKKVAQTAKSLDDDDLIARPTQH